MNYEMLGWEFYNFQDYCQDQGLTASLEIGPRTTTIRISGPHYFMWSYDCSGQPISARHLHNAKLYLNTAWAKHQAMSEGT